MKKEFSKILKSDGIVYTIIRGAIGVAEIQDIMSNYNLPSLDGDVFELVEHDVCDIVNVEAFPYENDMSWKNSVISKSGYTFFAMYYCNELSHGYCRQMRSLLSSETVVVELFNEKDRALDWLRQMIYTMGK